MLEKIAISVAEKATGELIDKGIEKLDKKIEGDEEKASDYSLLAGGIVLSLLPEIKNSSPEQLKNINFERTDAVRAKLSDIKTKTPEQLEYISEGNTFKSISENVEDIKEKLTEDDKLKIKEETGWSNEIIDAISSMEEYEVYKKAGLIEAEINGKKCLIRNDIDWDQKDENGRTNAERVKAGLSPFMKNGEKVELHHIGQHADSPFAELTHSEHHLNGNDSILHIKTLESEINRPHFDKERAHHWKDRGDQLGGG